MQNFAPEFETPEQYITDITYKIWEERGVGRIHDWYAADCPVRTPHGVTHNAEAVVASTLATLHEFPDRHLLAEAVIIGDKSNGFYSSHRVRSPATHLGNGSFGLATGRALTMLTIADCLCRENQVVEEWLVRDQAAMVRQLGGDIASHGAAMGRRNPPRYAIGNSAMRERWSDPQGLTIVGETDLTEPILNLYDAIWNGKKLHGMTEYYDRAVRFEGPGGILCYGRERLANQMLSMLAAIPDGEFVPHHLIVRQQPEHPTQAALRWSYCGTHSGHGAYGPPSGAPLALLGISHFELRNGRIVNEWMVVDETAIYAQIAAYSAGQQA